MSDPTEALSAWDWPAATRLEPAPSGNINPTWFVHTEAGPAGVLQSFNTRIFDPRLHENIEAVTARLEQRGLVTPRLVRTRSGALWHAHEGVWRVLTWVGDRTVHKIASPQDAVSAGRLVARFHAALHGFEWSFRPIWSKELSAGGTRAKFHDTAAYMASLRETLPAHPQHRLYEQVAPLADAILSDWERWHGPRDLAERVVHGDLKISNLRFQGDEAIALIDLDTLAPGTIDAELGDAFRSWCNPATEDDPETRFDLDLFEAGMRGYAEHAALTDDEWRSIVPGVQRIALELAARFARDALEESYFGYDPKHGGRGEHNLLRARSQHALARAVAAEQGRAEQIIDALVPRS